MKCDYTEVILTQNLEEQIYRLVLNCWEGVDRGGDISIAVKDSLRGSLKESLKEFIHHQTTHLLKERGAAGGYIETSSEFCKNLEVPERVKIFLKEMFKLVREVGAYQFERMYTLERDSNSGRMGEMATPEAIYRYFYHLKFLKQESMRAVYLRGYELLQTQDIFLGGANGLLMTAREIITPALKLDADQMILVHNHPSGNSIPSERDFEFTRKMAEITSKLKINFLDHIIIGNFFFSFRKEGLL